MAAETAGINVRRLKYQVMIISGVMGGLAGAHLSLGYSKMFAENITNGRGFMGIAAMNFGAQNPILVWVGTLIFGCIDSIGARLAVLWYSVPVYLNASIHLYHYRSGTCYVEKISQ